MRCVPQRVAFVIALAVIASFAQAVIGGGGDEDVVPSMAPSTCGDLCSDEALEAYARLSSLWSLGRREVERGAFLVRGSDGHLRLIYWPRADQELGATYTGQIPAGCVAIVHTHPPTGRSPSGQDVHEARRIRIPIVAVTSDAITVALPDGTASKLFGETWRRALRERTRPALTAKDDRP